MYSKHARMKVLLEFNVSPEVLMDIIRQHIKIEHIVELHWRADYYWVPWKGLIVVIDGKGSSQLKGYKCGVENWNWENMQDQLVYSIHT